MMKSVAGVYCGDGTIKLMESAPAGVGGRVIVTFLEDKSADLRERGINEQQAADLRHRLNAFAEDWDRPEMDVYDEV